MKDRSFVVSSPHRDLITKYRSLRPEKRVNDKFLFAYNEGVGINNPVGINKVGATPCVVAGFLNLHDKEKYTGHCFRRTSATLLAESGGTTLDLKKLGGWSSTTIAESYVNGTEAMELKLANKIFKSEPAVAPVNNEFDPQEGSSTNEPSKRNGFCFGTLNNCTFNFSLQK